MQAMGQVQQVTNHYSDKSQKHHKGSKHVKVVSGNKIRNELRQREWQDFAVNDRIYMNCLNTPKPGSNQEVNSRDCSYIAVHVEHVNIFSLI